MPISDIHTARSGIVTVNASTATPLHSVVGTAAKGPGVGVRVNIVLTTAAAGITLFQLARAANSSDGRRRPDPVAA
jgi:hypothetical protein